jgi:flagellin
MAQQNLNIDNQFQSSTIQQLTSGYRINSSGDDAAGLAVANGIQSNISQLNQGVLNANDGVSQLQIIDGGLSNISTILNRMQTLATESASSTFTGSRATLNQEYSGLVSEITRQASNIGLNTSGSFNTNLSVFIGGAGSNTANANVNIDLSGAQNAVDATSLGLNSTNVLGGGVGLTGGTANTQRLDAPGALFLAGGGSQTLTLNVYANGQAQTVTATVQDTSVAQTGVSETSVLSQLNTQLNSYGISAGVDSNGLLSLTGGTAFTVEAAGTASAGTGIVTAGGTAANTANYNLDAGTYVAPTGNDKLTFQTAAGSASVTLASATTLADAINDINDQTSGVGVYATLNAAGTGISFQSASSFEVNDTANAAGKGVFGAAGLTTGLNKTATAPVAGTTSNATAAITAINNAIQQIGLVQGKIGAGENTLNYAINLAQSQITNFSAAESQIKDANVAEEAANLTKAQVLTQTSVAALAQANSEPQAILKLLQ